jgi:hypothetical protein
VVYVGGRDGGPVLVLLLALVRGLLESLEGMVGGTGG